MDDILVDADNTPQAEKRQATLKEMARKAQDRILVFNPTDDDYTVRFDSIGFVIPNRNKDNGHGLGRAVVFRYVAENYLTQMVDLILTTEMDTAVRLENEKRANLGQQPMTKFVGGEEPQFTNSLRTDNSQARRKLIPTIWLDLAERYGDDTQQETTLGKPKDDRPLDQRLLDELDSQAPKMAQKRPSNEDIATAREQINNLPADPDFPGDLASKDVFTLRKIAKEKGIETAKTDKKDELLAKISQ